jgi:hypothetical protein
VYYYRSYLTESSGDSHPQSSHHHVTSHNSTNPINRIINHQQHSTSHITTTRASWIPNKDPVYSANKHVNFHGNAPAATNHDKLYGFHHIQAINHLRNIGNKEREMYSYHPHHHHIGSAGTSAVKTGYRFTGRGQPLRESMTKAGSLAQSHPAGQAIGMERGLYPYGHTPEVDYHSRNAFHNWKPGFTIPGGGSFWHDPHFAAFQNPGEIYMIHHTPETRDPRHNPHINHGQHDDDPPWTPIIEGAIDARSI